MTERKSRTKPTVATADTETRQTVAETEIIADEQVAATTSEPDHAVEESRGDDLARRAQQLVTDVIEDVVEEDEVNGTKIRHKGIYLLPNLFTTGALFFGFYAIVSGMNGNFNHAAIAIFVAMVLDGLDGRVARLTGTQSAFGAEYDSLADVVSFGVAPAVIAFAWMLQDLGQIGWIAAFIYVAGAALRLARFNVQIGHTDCKWFVGLPSPSAAAIVSSLVWVLHDFDLEFMPAQILVALVIAVTGILMVSNVRFYSFKDIDLKGRVPFMMLLLLVLVIAIISIEPPVMLLLLSLGYGVSGPVCTILFRRRKEMTK